MIPSSRSCPQPGQKDCAWHMESIWITGKRILEINFPRSSPRSRKDEDKSHKWRQTEIKAQFQCRHLRQSRWLRVLQFGNTAELHGGQQRQQIWELQFDKFTNQKLFSVWKNSIQNLSDILFWFFHRKQCYGPTKWRWFGRVEIFAISLWKGCAFALKKIIPEFPLQEKGQSRGAESSETWQFPSMKTDCLHDPRDYFRVTGAHDTILDYADLFSVTLHDDNIQEFNTRWDEVPTVYDKNSIPWHLGKSVKIEDTWATQKPYWNCTTWRFIRRYRFATIKSWNPWWREEKRSETSITKLWRQAWENWIRSSGKESKGMNRRWREKRYLWQVERKRPVSHGDRCSFRHETPRSCAKNQNTLPPRLQSQPYHEVEVCRGREVSETNVTMGPFFDNCPDVIWKVPARERLVNIGIRPSANSLIVKWVVRLETSVCFRITRLTNNQIESQTRATSQNEEKTMTRMLWLSWKVYYNWLASRKTRMHWFLKEENSPRGNPMQKVLGSTRKVRFTQSTLRQASIREKKGPSLGKRNVNVPHQRSPYAMKFEDRSNEETERQQRCARSKAWNLAKNIYKLKEKDKTTFCFPAEEWVLPLLRQQKSRRKESLWLIPERVCMQYACGQ